MINYLKGIDRGSSSGSLDPQLSHVGEYADAGLNGRAILFLPHPGHIHEISDVSRSLMILSFATLSWRLFSCTFRV